MNRVLGGILLAIGILVAGLSGLCSLLLIVTSIPSMTARDISDGLPIVLVVGGIPFLVGLAAIWGGRKLMQTDSGDGQPPASATSRPPSHPSPPQENDPT